jgi:hypothetical protein
MVLKPAPQDNLVPRPLSQAVNNPPYPISPTTEVPPVLPHTSAEQNVYSPDLAASPAFNLRPLGDVQREKDLEDNDSDYSEDWDKSDDEDSRRADLPSTLKIARGKPLSNPATAPRNEIPDLLKAGPPAGIPIKKPADPIQIDPTGSAPLHSNNPYLRMHTTGQSNFGGESSQQAWGDLPSQANTYGQLAELSSVRTPDTPTNHMSSLTLNSNDPLPKSLVPSDQVPLIAAEPSAPPPLPPNTNPPPVPLTSEHWNHGVDLSSPDPVSTSNSLPFYASQPENTQQAWQEHQGHQEREQYGQERMQTEAVAAPEAAAEWGQERPLAEDTHRTENAVQYTPDVTPEEQFPVLPPRRSQEEDHPPPMPPRPIDTGVGGPSQAGPESPNTAMQRQRKEHYQIKHIRWLDATTHQIRTSPILTQNINGPCPLLALVNALVLSTPAGVQSEFVESLRTREQISLGFLLDAVFEELMSGRRGEAAQALPDVNDLYKFLLGLQTGLNVNPMFVHDSEATDGPSTLVSTFAVQPGGFEDTKDMQLYRTFNLSLWHGWLPEPGSDAYIAFERVAKSYETSQFVQFQEEELLAKLQDDSSLSEDEQRLFTDIQALKEFLSQWPTQLTDYGLQTMRDSMKPGQVAILFRNDHFSTLYKNPHTNELMTLVTDHGYSTHDEIVWESLNDVSGQGSEFYSGDFRAVGNNNAPQRQEQQATPNLIDLNDNEGWTTVSGRRQNNQNSSTAVSAQNTEVSAPVPAQNSTEQEDHDLALALQLQEEEDDRHRRSLEERRQRENRLSENAIAAHSSQNRPNNQRSSRAGENPPLIPPRRNNVQTHRPSNDPAPPPTYEEAATSPRYNPPRGHPANPNALLTPQGPQNSAPPANMAGIPQGQGGRRMPGRPMGMPQNVAARPGRRQSQVQGQSADGSNEQDKDRCVVM